MKILSLDSTAKVASCAVLDDERLLSLFTVDNGLTHSELLLPMIEDSLKTLKLRISDIDLFAVTVGPGSFTGVRIGAAVIKGLTFGKDKPISPVSTLESLAYNAKGLSGIIVPVMDARRGQVYTAIFKGNDGEIERVTEDIAIPITELAEMLKGYNNEKIYLTGDGYELTRDALLSLGIVTELTPPLLLRENAYSVGLVGLKMHREGLTVTDTALAPTYLRVPQAERERLSKLRNGDNK